VELPPASESRRLLRFGNLHADYPVPYRHSFATATLAPNAGYARRPITRSD
jgi:hypothetical protein